MLAASGLPASDAEDASDDLAKFAAEMEKPDKDAGRIQKIWARIKENAPTVAVMLASAASIAKLLHD